MNSSTSLISRSTSYCQFPKLQSWHFHIAGTINGYETLSLHFVPNHFQDFVVTLTKVHGTATVHLQKIFQFFIVQSPKRNIYGHQSITYISLKKSYDLFPLSDELFRITHFKRFLFVWNLHCSFKLISANVLLYYESFFYSYFCVTCHTVQNTTVSWKYIILKHSYNLL
jgi:hypothetical protein